MPPGRIFQRNGHMCLPAVRWPISRPRSCPGHFSIRWVPVKGFGSVRTGLLIVFPPWLTVAAPSAVCPWNHYGPSWAVISSPCHSLFISFEAWHAVVSHLLLRELQWLHRRMWCGDVVRWGGCFVGCWSFCDWSSYFLLSLPHRLPPFRLVCL